MFLCLIVGEKGSDNSLGYSLVVINALQSNLSSKLQDDAPKPVAQKSS